MLLSVASMKAGLTVGLSHVSVGLILCHCQKGLSWQTAGGPWSSEAHTRTYPVVESSLRPLLDLVSGSNRPLYRSFHTSFFDLLRKGVKYLIQIHWHWMKWLLEWCHKPKTGLLHRGLRSDWDSSTLHTNSAILTKLMATVVHHNQELLAVTHHVQMPICLCARLDPPLDCTAHTGQWTWISPFTFAAHQLFTQFLGGYYSLSGKKLLQYFMPEKKLSFEIPLMPTAMELCHSTAFIGDCSMSSLSGCLPKLLT